MIKIFIFLFILLIVCLIGGIHKVQEGFVGIYYRFGALENVVTEPGFHFMIPVITQFRSIQVNIQTDKVKDIPCGTSGGVLIQFEKIEVVNQLQKSAVIDTVKQYGTEYDKIWIYDKIHHEINQFCSSHTLNEIYIEKFETLDEELKKQLDAILKQWIPGLSIIGIRVTKPRIPQLLRQNFEQMESERAKYLVAVQRKQVLVQEANSKQTQEIIKAKGELEVAKIQIERQISEKANELKVAMIESEIYISKEKSMADSYFYTEKKNLETLSQKLTTDFLQHQALESLTTNLNLIIGDHIPTYLASGSITGK